MIYNESSKRTLKINRCRCNISRKLTAEEMLCIMSTAQYKVVINSIQTIPIFYNEGSKSYKWS